MFRLHYWLERKAIGFALCIILVASIGGIVEIAPLFTIHQTVEDAPDMRVYTPLELAGRNIYVREGCYACHSQMIRTLRDEVERYGPYSLAVESKYDHPMLWGSKRTGPDIARVGGKYSDEWHVTHLINPRDVVPESVMPPYARLLRNRLRTDDLGLHLKAMRTVGVPYTDEMIANARADAYGQASPDSPLAEGVSKRYGSAAALQPTDLNFARGQTTVLIGPSGCGKSTMLRLIIRLLEPDSGKIKIDGASVSSSNITEFRHRVGYVIQDGGLFPHLTARGNILLMARQLNKRIALDELCALTRFPAQALDRFPAELSGGQRQRVSLMRALALTPKLLLLDEPLGALDPLVRAALQKDLKEIFQRLQQTAILVTHDLAEAAFLGNEIVLMNEGRIVQKGTLGELRSHAGVRPAYPLRPRTPASL